jgi:hypothetical protein
VTVVQIVLKTIISRDKIFLTMKIILIKKLRGTVLQMAFAFVGGTVLVYAFVMKHVLKNVTH